MIGAIDRLMFPLDTHGAPADSASPFTVDYACSTPAGPEKDDAGRPVLAAIRFSAQGASTADAPGCITVGAKPLGDMDTEVWRSAQPVSYGYEHGIAFSRNDDVLVAHLRVREQDYGGMEAATFEAYRRICAFLRDAGYAYPLRVWNWFPHINDVQNALERYRSFCLGRYRALESLGTGHLPAASAIGTQDGEFLIYFLAARSSGMQVENPRQISAFRYPPRYSPKSPSFSRAVVKRWGETAHLYISGTASIVGHETRHTDTLAQLDESLRNLNALIRHADRRHRLGIRGAAGLSLLKVYLRYPEDREAVQERLTKSLGARAPTLLLRGDICRAELRLEVEGVYTGRGGR